MQFIADDDGDDDEVKTLKNSLRSILSEPGNDVEQSSKIDAAAAAMAESTVNAIMEHLQLDLTLQSILHDENICNNHDVNAALLLNLAAKSEEDAKNITDDEIDTSKSATENPPLDQTIVEEIDLAVTIAMKSDEIERNLSSSSSSSIDVSIDGLKDVQEDITTENASNDESIAAFMPFSGEDAKFSSSEMSSGHSTTPMKAMEHHHGEENICSIVHGIMEAVDQLFECVF